MRYGLTFVSPKSYAEALTPNAMVSGESLLAGDAV